VRGGLLLASPRVGHRIAALAFHAMGVRVVNLRRAQGQAETVTDDTPLRAGDTLVLSGQSRALALAEDKLLRG